MAHGEPGEPGADATTAWPAMEEALRYREEIERRAKHYDALREALRGLLPVTEDDKCKRCAEGIERNDDMYHWNTGYTDNRCLDHHNFEQARAILDATKEE